MKLWTTVRTGNMLVLGLFLLILSPAFADPPKDPAGKERDVFGYTAVFDRHLDKIGQISPDEFGKRFAPKVSYLDKLSFDPTKAKFWTAFQTNPATTNSLWGGDYRLNAQELAIFKKNGFVVSERLGSASFAEVYYRIYSRDLPVFISADSILHAWHRSYDAMLEQLEETYLSRSLDEILTEMAKHIEAANKAYGGGVLKASVLDADYFLAVARSLLAGQPVKSKLGQDSRVAVTLKACDGLKMQKFELFGRYRVVDFSQFKVRGHYENSELLKRYFRAMMWCGRIDLRVAGGKEYNLTASSPRELGGAVVLNDLLKLAGKTRQWQQFDRIIQTFVGRTDSMTFGQLDALLRKGGIKSPADVKHLTTLTGLQKQILMGKLGLQQIRSDYVVSSPFGPDKAELPRSFTVLGQKFVLDSFATAKVVADDVMWDEMKVQRRIPIALDVAFSVFANDHVVPELVNRMKDRHGRKFRDGLNYQHNLAAMRLTMDEQNSATWEESIYTHWLATLRELSRPTTADSYPEAMRTRAWAMKSLNTQLASWAQLRHDTILYVKQSYTSGADCEYPAGFVEPIPHFWARLEKMAARAADLIEKTPFPDHTVVKETPHGLQRAKLSDVQFRQAAFFRNFAKQTALLKVIAEKQRAQKPLTAAETKVLKDVVQVSRGSGQTFYNGWYPKLFYGGPTDCGKWDALVADVHTNVPAPRLGDPGCVLTQGVGGVDLLLVAIDSGKDRMVYAGPLLSHYEFEMPGVTRKSDSEWQKQLTEGKAPPRPAWTKGYLIPGGNRDLKRQTGRE